MTLVGDKPRHRRGLPIRSIIKVTLCVVVLLPILVLVRMPSSGRPAKRLRPAEGSATEEAPIRRAAEVLQPDGPKGSEAAAAAAAAKESASAGPAAPTPSPPPPAPVGLPRYLVNPWAANLHTWDLHVSCTPELCQRHVRNTPPSWWGEVSRWSLRVVYVVGGGEPARVEAERLVHEAAEQIHARAAVDMPLVIMSLDVEDAYPPVRKEVAMLRHIKHHGVATRPFVHLDADALVVPRRLIPMLKAVPLGSKTVYTGRPVSSCECNQREKQCTYARATHYCSGAMYITTRATLQTIPDDAFVPARNGSGMCKSSDLSVGAMMNSAGLTCTPFRDAEDPRRQYPGLTWPMRKDSKQYTVSTPICQQVGQPGGIHVKRTVSLPWFVDQQHRHECVAYHPAKKRYDMQYVWNLLFNDGDDTAPEDVEAGRRMNRLAHKVPGACPMAVFLPVLPHRFDVRQAVRVTWGKAALALGMRVVFVAGVRDVTTELRMTRRVLEFENATHGDILLSPYSEGYDRLPFKSLAALGEAPLTGCQVYAKVDPDSYFRPYQAIKAMEVLEVNHKPHAEFYVGHVWDAKKTGKPNVQHDPNSPWFIGFEGDFYPPFCSGYTYMLSMPLAARVYGCLRPAVRSGGEDIQTALCVHKVGTSNTHIIHSKHLEYSRKCDMATVSDNAVATPSPYNLLQRHEANVRGDFCSLGIRKFSAGSRSYPLSVADFDVQAVDNTPDSNYLKVTMPPWEIAAPKAKPDQFVFQDIPDVERSQFKLSSLEARRGTEAFATLARHTPDKVWAYKCVGCLSAWYQTIHVAASGGKGHSAQAVAVNSDSTAAFGRRADLPTKFDLAVPHGCRPDKAAFFGKQLQQFKEWDMRLLITAMGCGPGQPADDPRALRDALVKASGFPVARVVVVDATTRKFERAASRNLLHLSARAGSVLVLSDLDMELKPGVFTRAAAFARPGVSAYFPIVFSRFDPEMVGLTEAFYKRKVNRELQGKWRPYGFGNYALAAEDARKLLMNEDFKGWGGEDDDFFKRVRARLHVIRYEDGDIVHSFHGKDCSTIDDKRWHSCVGAAGGYSGSPLAMYLKFIAGMGPDGKVPKKATAPAEAPKPKPPPPAPVAKPAPKSNVLQVESEDQYD